MNQDEIAPEEVDEETPEEETSEEDVLRVAKERFDLAKDAEQSIREKGLEDLEFRAGKQWPDNVRSERDQDGRPCLVINRIPQFVRQVTNDQRQNRPSIKVSPVDDKADPETAKILQGLIRHIEYNSNADIAYDTAFEGAVTKGFGYFRIITDYVDPMSFEQEILIKRIKNHFQVFLDPGSKEPDGSDANWGFIVEDVSKEDYEAEYGESKLASMDDWESLGAQAPEWLSGKSCRVAEYFYKEFKKIPVVQLSNGEVIPKSEFVEGVIGPDGMPISVVKERVSSVPVIKWCKINALEILEETIWPGKWIPIVPVYGDELDVNGQRILEGVIRHAKDSQRMYNYWASTETETIALAPRAPYIAAEGQIPKEYEAWWQSANRKPHAFLPYKPTSLNGQPIAPPQRQVYEAPVQAITGARMQASEDLKATTGIYDAALGARSNENSGIAIQRRNAQSQTSNFHYVDNLTRSLRHAGRILVDLIPKIYDTARTARIIGENDEQKIVPLNQPFQEQGEPRLFDLSVGKYDVTVSTGPSFATKRQEALASMIDLTKAYPQLAQYAGDILVKNMDWPGADEFAERIRKTLPPGLAEPKDGEKKPVPPEAQAQMAQMGQMIEALTKQLSAANEDIKNKTIEIESRERIETMKIERDYKLKLMELQGSAANAILLKELADIDRRQAQLGMNEPIEDESNDFIGPGPEQAVSPQNQQPTGGLSPGNYMGE